MNYLLLTMAFLLAVPQSMLGMNKTYSAQATETLKRAIHPERFDLKLVKQAIADNANVNIQIDIGNKHLVSPLAAAASLGNVEAVEALIKAGVDVNKAENGPESKGVGSIKLTPLMYAVPGTSSRVSIPQVIKAMELLLNSGANINAQDAFGYTALMTAVTGARPEIVEFLLQHGARADIKNTFGKTAFDLKGVYRQRGNRAAADAIDKQIQDMLKYYEQRPEIKAAVAAHTGTPAGVAGIVTSYLFGEEPKKPAAAGAGSGSGSGSAAGPGAGSAAAATAPAKGVKRKRQQSTAEATTEDEPPAQCRRVAGAGSTASTTQDEEGDVQMEKETSMSEVD